MLAGARRKRADTATTTSPEKAREGAGAPPARQGRAGHQQKRPRPSQKGCKKRVRVSEGVYKDRYGLAATVKVTGMQRERRFPRGTPIRTIQAWRDEMRGNLRTLPKGAKHTLSHDAKRYLDQVEGQLVSIRDRRRNLGLWLEKFGHMRTLSLEQHVTELNGQLHQWRKERSGATCNHRRDALMNLVRVLYGRRAASGLSDLVMLPEGATEAAVGGPSGDRRGTRARGAGQQAAHTARTVALDWNAAVPDGSADAAKLPAGRRYPQRDRRPGVKAGRREGGGHPPAE